MKEKMRDKILVVAVILIVGFCLMALSSNQTVARIKSDLDRERYKRMVAEENFNKMTLKANSLEAELTGARDKIQTAQTILEEGKIQTSDLKSQLESVSRTKEALEKKVEELSQATALQAKSSSGQNP